VYGSDSTFVEYLETCKKQTRTLRYPPRLSGDDPVKSSSIIGAVPLLVRRNVDTKFGARVPKMPVWPYFQSNTALSMVFLYSLVVHVRSM